MKLGKRIETDIGNLLVLDVQDNYLVLFDDLENRFVKAINYESDYLKTYWEDVKYFTDFTDLIKSLI